MVELPWAWSGWEELLCCSPSAEEALEKADWGSPGGVKVSGWVGSQGVGEDFQSLGAVFPTTQQLPFLYSALHH